jgi:multicomponent K+:H+ antiporter subunit C
MELLMSSAIGVLVAAGIWLLLRERTFTVMLGLTLLSYAVNLFIFSMGRLATNAPPLIAEGVERYADPLPQALVLTAIVISFGMTALLLVLAVRLRFDTGSDHVDSDTPAAPSDADAPATTGPHAP